MELEDSQQHNFKTPKTHESIHLYLKNDYEEFKTENNITEVDYDLHGANLKEFEVDDDTKFHEILGDKCKIIIKVV